MADYDIQRLHRELAALPDGTSTTSKGRKLQDLVEYLLCQMPGVTVTHRNKLNAAHSEEKDLWVGHIPVTSQLPFTDFAFPVECKNEDRPASAAEVREFAAKIRDSGGFDGLLVATAGLAGKGTTDSAHHVISAELGRHIRITVLVGADLPGLCTTDDLMSLLIDRHLELRVNQTYHSI